VERLPLSVSFFLLQCELADPTVFGQQLPDLPVEALDAAVVIFRAIVRMMPVRLLKNTVRRLRRMAPERLCRADPSTARKRMATSFRESDWGAAAIAANSRGSSRDDFAV